MPIPSTYPSQSPIIQFSTAADGYYHVFYCQTIRWNLTTAATSTWALAVCQSSAVAGSTYAWPVIGSSTASLFLGGSTAALVSPGIIEFRIDNYLWGITVPTISGGTLHVIKGNPPVWSNKLFTT